MDQESELIQKVNALEQKIEKNHSQLLLGVSAVAAGILAAALGVALGGDLRAAAYGCIGAGAITVLLGRQLKSYKR